MHNGAEQWVDISYSGQDPTAYFMVESATLDLFVLLGPTPKETVRQFTNLTGTAHMPQVINIYLLRLCILLKDLHCF